MIRRPAEWERGPAAEAAAAAADAVEPAYRLYALRCRLGALVDRLAEGDLARLVELLERARPADLRGAATYLASVVDPASIGGWGEPS